MKLNVNEIVYREDLYPRFEANQTLIQRYANSIEHLPPIEINQSNILIDGYHRWKAHQLNGELEIAVKVTETESEKELKRLAYIRNSNHGLQLSNDEKRRYAAEMIAEMSVKELTNILSVNERTISRWTETQRKALEEERNRKIVELYLRAWNTQESIADMFGISQPAVLNIIKSGQMSETYKEFNPPIYNIWKLSKQDNATKSHFGSFPLYFMKSLLYYHTDPMDIVFDPFAGGGTTVDACKEMMRRYYCTDRIVKPGREKDILQHNITAGLPDGLPKPDMVFLDPPYWIQAEGLYSSDPDDLANMSLDDFYLSMCNLFDEIAKRNVDKIALVIQPTQYKNNFIFEDHIFKFDKMLSNKYEIEMRYILPYSTQQYNAQMVNKAKDERICLANNRDLIIWRLA
jgi:DNA modification methylase